MNLRDLARHAATVQRLARTAPRDLRTAADLIETGSDLVAQFADSPLATAMGLARAASAAPKPKRAPSTRAPSVASFRPPAAPREAPIKVAPAVLEVIDATFDETVIDPSKPAPKRR